MGDGAGKRVNYYMYKIRDTMETTGGVEAWQEITPKKEQRENKFWVEIDTHSDVVCIYLRGNTVSCLSQSTACGAAQSG